MKPPKCQICGKQESTDFKPFCSKRCADTDLLRWLNGSYSIPTTQGDDATQNDMDDDEHLQH